MNTDRKPVNIRMSEAGLPASVEPVNANILMIASIETLRWVPASRAVTVEGDSE